MTEPEAASTMDDVLATVDVRRRRFTVEEYYRMAEVGILTESERVELIEGEIIEMSPIGLRHVVSLRPPGEAAPLRAGRRAGGMDRRSHSRRDRGLPAAIAIGLRLHAAHRARRHRRAARVSQCCPRGDGDPSGIGPRARALAPPAHLDGRLSAESVLRRKRPALGKTPGRRTCRPPGRYRAQRPSRPRSGSVNV